MNNAESIGVLVLGCTNPKNLEAGIILSRPNANSSRVVAACTARQQTKIATQTEIRNALVTQLGKWAAKM